MKASEEIVQEHGGLRRLRAIRKREKPQGRRRQSVLDRNDEAVGP
jgi:hypothetical protein